MKTMTAVHAMMTHLTCFIVFGLLSISLTAPAQDLFSAKTDFKTGEGPISICSGIFSNDGNLNIAAANYKSNTLSIFCNTTRPGGSSPSFSAKMDIATGECPMSVSAGDFNGDGKLDLAVANYNSNTLSIFMNTTRPGDAVPSFSHKIDFPTGERPISVSTGDFNGDGKPDVAVVNYKSNTVSIFLNTTARGAASPTFSSPLVLDAGIRPVSVAIGDFNGDGKPDIAAANYRSNSISVFLNTTGENDTVLSFSVKTDFPVGERPMWISTGDLNGDGKPDLVSADYGSNSVSVLLNSTSRGAAAPSFAAKSDLVAGTNPQSVCIVDVDGDGKPDLAVANYNGATISVFLNTTDRGAAAASFSPRRDLISGIAPSSLCSGKLPGAERPDIFAANFGSNTFSVFMNLTALHSIPSK